MKRGLFFLIGIISMVLVSHFVFERVHLYEEFVWLDIPMHILGGFLVYGFLSGFILKRYKEKDRYFLSLALFLCIASVWEWNEFFVRQVVERSWYGVFDTIKDYIDGVIGLSIGHHLLNKRN